MTYAAALVIETVPLVGIVLSGRRAAWHDLFVVCYLAAVGLLLSGIGLVDDYYDLTRVIGVFTGAEF